MWSPNPRVPRVSKGSTRSKLPSPCPEEICLFHRVDTGAEGARAVVAETVGPQHAQGHGTRPCWPSRVPPRSQQETDRLHLRTSLAKLKTEFYYMSTLEYGHFQHPVTKWEMPKIKNLPGNEGRQPSRPGRPHCGRGLTRNRLLRSCGHAVFTEENGRESEHGHSDSCLADTSPT